MNNIIVIDFETAYSNEYSLKNLNYVEYVNDQKFEVIGVAVKVNDQPTEWFSGSKEKTAQWLEQFPWGSSIAVAHNAAFDMYILHKFFGIKPKAYADTLSMARPKHGVGVGGSLSKLADHYGIGEKGTEVINALGKWRNDFTEHGLKLYGEYCINDVELTHKLFYLLLELLPPIELKVIDCTIRMTVEPKLEYDTQMLEDALLDLQMRKDKILEDCGITKDDLMSNQKFAKVLESLGVEPPTKISLTTGKETFAFAKTDPGMVELLEHEDETIQLIASARVETKSTLAEGRMQRLIKASKFGAVPFPLRYAGAHTNRFSGDWKWNMQNLPKHKANRREALRDALGCAEGHSIIALDSSQIEARVNAWLSGEDELVELFATGGDPYCTFATIVYNKQITKKDVTERFVGKGCIAEGSLVLTDKGLVPIEKITLEHRLWDGVEWVNHQGLIYKGVKDVITYNGLTATPDHGVFTEFGAVPIGVAASRLDRLVATGNGGQAVRASGDYFDRNISPEEEHLLVRKMYKMWCDQMDLQPQLTTRQKPRLSALFTDQIAALSSFGAAVRRNSASLYESLKPTLQRLWRSWDTPTVFLQNAVHPMGERESSAQGLCGGGNRSGGQQQALRAGQPASSHQSRTGSQPEKHHDGERWRGEYTTVTMGGMPLCQLPRKPHGESGYDWRADTRSSTRASADSSWQMENGCQKARVYDIANAGPRRRFTVSGVLVLNCVLGLGFMMGSKKLQDSLKKPVNGVSADLPEDECKRLVSTYRYKYRQIVKFWKSCGEAIEAMIHGTPFEFGIGAKIRVEHEALILPSGNKLYYPNLTRYEGEKGPQYTYTDREAKKTKKLYSGLLCENIVQSVARDIICWQMVKANSIGYPAVGTVHDELIFVSPDESVEDDIRVLEGVMKSTPKWAVGCPISCEGAYAKTYGET